MITHSSGYNTEDSRSDDDDAVPIAVATECSESTENVYNGDQHQAAIW